MVSMRCAIYSPCYNILNIFVWFLEEHLSKPTLITIEEVALIQHITSIEQKSFLCSNASLLFCKSFPSTTCFFCGSHKNRLFLSYMFNRTLRVFSHHRWFDLKILFPTWCCSFSLDFFCFAIVHKHFMSPVRVFDSTNADH